ncbi:hypothetical protein SAMN05216436_10982 [bacterium A37T11]|nr:hypothetical protein SAMN05216436_10982 [bacterium A37T11]
MIYRRFLLIIICGLLTDLTGAFATQRSISIHNFIVRENLTRNGKLAIIACDTANKPIESVNGTFRFVLNGFQQELRFHDGVAVSPLPIDKSAFVFVKHQDESGSYGKLYFVMKKDDGSLNPIAINWIWLIAIPLGIIMIIYMFRKLLIWGLLILAALFYFNYSKGLDLDNIFDTIFHGIKSLF